MATYFLLSSPSFPSIFENYYYYHVLPSHPRLRRSLRSLLRKCGSLCQKTFSPLDDNHHHGLPCFWLCEPLGSTDGKRKDGKEIIQMTRCPLILGEMPAILSMWSTPALCPQTVTGPEKNGLDPSRLPMKIHTVCSASLGGEPDTEFAGAQGLPCWLCV